MRRLEADVVVIGGGSTGVGVVRDAAMRGYRAVLVDRADLGQGTTGRFHGLLHSGGRYVVSDPGSARECAEENAILTRIQSDAIEKTGGLFVTAPGDDPAYGDRFLAGASATGVPAREIAVAEALRREPRLNPRITRAIEVSDGTVDGWQLVWGAARSAKEYGAQVLTYHRVAGIERDGDRVGAVLCRDEKAGEDVRIDCGFVLNCAGVWAGQIAHLAGCAGVEVVPGRGIMIAMNHRLVNQVVNRLVYPTDGDILVPVHTVSIIGTTDAREENPDILPIPHDEVQQMLDAGEALVPGFRQARALHAWSGARPLMRDTRVSEADTRHMSRGMAIIDHLDRDGLAGLLTICGGKLTTYRLMAEHIVDAMCAQLDDPRPCKTALESVPGSESGQNYQVTHRLRDREADRLDDQIICECELMSRGMFVSALQEQPTALLDDLRRQLRLGMGPCQGGYCSTRAVGIAHEHGSVDAPRANELLRGFLTNRWIGLWPILYGDQVRQTALDDWILAGTLDVDHLPGRPSQSPPATAAAAPSSVDAADSGSARPMPAPTVRRLDAGSAPKATRDVAVVGAGLAGLAAAIRLAQAGRSVTLVAKGVGGLQLGQGTLDLLGYVGPARLDRPLGSLADLGEGHPYAAVGADGIRASARWLASLLPDLLVGDPDANVLLPTALGVLRPTALFAPSMAAGVFDPDARYLILGLRRLKDFAAGLAAANLAAQGGRARASIIDFQVRDEADTSGLNFARALDDPANRARLAALIRGQARDGEIIGLPAVLGLDDHAAWSDVATLAGVQLFEIPLPPPNVPGMRLNRALTKIAVDAGVRFIRGSKIIGGTAFGDRLVSLRVGSKGHPTELAATDYVFAPGGFESGALDVDSYGRIREAALGLPLTASDARGLIQADYWGPQPLYDVGVRTDGAMRVLDADGTPTYANLRAAGSILAGATRWREKSGDGIALSTALRAADAIIGGLS